MKGDLRRRLLVAAVGIPASVIVVYAGGVFLALGLGFLAAVGFWEYAELLRKTGYRPFLPVGILTAVALPFCVLEAGLALAWLVAIAALAGGSAWAIYRLEPAERPISNVAITMFGALYLGGFLSLGIPLRAHPVAGWLGSSDPRQSRVRETTSRAVARRSRAPCSSRRRRRSDARAENRRSTPGKSG